FRGGNVRDSKADFFGDVLECRNGGEIAAVFLGGGGVLPGHGYGNTLGTLHLCQQDLGRQWVENEEKNKEKAWPPESPGHAMTVPCPFFLFVETLRAAAYPHALTRAGFFNKRRSLRKHGSRLSFVILQKGPASAVGQQDLLVVWGVRT